MSRPTDYHTRQIVEAACAVLASAKEGLVTHTPFGGGTSMEVVDYTLKADDFNWLRNAVEDFVKHNSKARRTKAATDAKAIVDGGAS